MKRVAGVLAHSFVLNQTLDAEGLNLASNDTVGLWDKLIVYELTFSLP